MFKNWQDSEDLITLEIKERLISNCNSEEAWPDLSYFNNWTIQLMQKIEIIAISSLNNHESEKSFSLIEHK